MQFKCFNIKWDTDDGEGHKPSPRSLGLPESTVIDVEIDTDLDEAEQISDALSDKFGFCHDGFEYERR